MPSAARYVNVAVRFSARSRLVRSARDCLSAAPRSAYSLARSIESPQRDAMCAVGWLIVPDSRHLIDDQQIIVRWAEMVGLASEEGESFTLSGHARRNDEPVQGEDVIAPGSINAKAAGVDASLDDLSSLLFEKIQRHAASVRPSTRGRAACPAARLSPASECRMTRGEFLQRGSPTFRECSRRESQLDQPPQAPAPP